MKLKTHTLMLAVLLPSIALGQRQLTREQALEDYHILKNVLTKGHPALYDYTSQSEWNSLFDNFENEQLATIRNNNDLYRSLTKLTDHVRDGHLIVMRPLLDSVPKLFPLLVKIIDKRLYTDTDDFGIPVGSEILSIDGISGSKIRQNLMEYAPSDGFNTSKKDRQVEREFGILHFYEFGVKTAYDITYKTPHNQTHTKRVESEPFEHIGQRFAKRNSYLPMKALGIKKPSVHFIDSLNTAVLTVNTFYLNAEEYQSTLKDVFKTIKRKKAKNLVIDIRQNEGGYPVNAIHTYSYVANDAFKQRNSSEVVVSVLPEKQYSQNLVNGYTYETFFEEYYLNAEHIENRWIQSNDENEPLMTPNKKRYTGNVYVMIGGQTFSAGSSFALFCKNQGIPLVGEETGGGYYSQTGGYPIIYTLPNSKIQVLISLVKINRHVRDTTVKKGSGVQPDIEVNLTVEDLINGKDSQLQHVLKLIRNN
ncbi:MAG: hypothetical protein JJ975_00640 [Bacteroidia bacterium]|nr:hypothetical protein [Bacteroidia bacterium]